MSNVEIHLQKYVRYGCAPRVVMVDTFTASSMLPAALSPRHAVIKSVYFLTSLPVTKMSQQLSVNEMPFSRFALKTDSCSSNLFRERANLFWRNTFGDESRDISPWENVETPTRATGWGNPQYHSGLCRAQSSSCWVS